MRYILVLLLFVLSMVSANCQLLQNNFEKINKKNCKIARHDLICYEGEGLISKISNLKYSKKLSFLPIASFVISTEATKYDSTSQIIDYLKFNKKTPLLEYYTLIDEEYEGVKSLFNTVYFNGKGFSSAYDSSKVFLKHYYTTEMYECFKILDKYQFKFLFSVKYFRDTIWFITDNEVLLLDKKELKVYNPDEYIRQKCSIEIIHNLAQNRISKFCD